MVSLGASTGVIQLWWQVNGAIVHRQVVSVKPRTGPWYGFFEMSLPKQVDRR